MQSGLIEAASLSPTIIGFSSTVTIAPSSDPSTPSAPFNFPSASPVSPRLVIGLSVAGVVIFLIGSIVIVYYRSKKHRARRAKNPAAPGTPTDKA